jgi:crotonobetainyl-CoA:carnitine CoA-transferase CaiB-like acyl-CoA transferase
MRFMDAGELLVDEHVAARTTIVELDGPDRTRVLANPIRTDGGGGDRSTCALSPPSELGEHTHEALTAAGFAPDEIAALREQGVV